MAGKPRNVDRHEHCEKCGQPHPQCTAHNKRGEPCGKAPMKKLHVCAIHGGTVPAAREKSRRLDLEARVRGELASRWAVGVGFNVTDPLNELARVAGEAVAWKDALAGHVRALDDVLTYWNTRDVTIGFGEDAEVRTEAIEQARAVVVLYEKALDRAANILAKMVTLDIAGRMATIRESQADAVVEAVRAGLATVDLEVDVHRAIVTAIAEAIGAAAVPDPYPVAPLALEAAT